MIAMPGINEGIVNWSPVVAIDNVDGSVSAICTIPSVSSTTSVMSGESFPVGTTTVTCTATDSSLNTGMCQFNVTVLGKLLLNSS